MAKPKHKVQSEEAMDAAHTGGSWGTEQRGEGGVGSQGPIEDIQHRRSHLGLFLDVRALETALNFSASVSSSRKWRRQWSRHWER